MPIQSKARRSSRGRLPRTLASLLLLGVALGGLSRTVAGQGSELLPVPEPPPIPERVRSGEAIDPDIQIRDARRGDDVITEYRVDGRLRAVKITPRVGPPYYLYDVDGDGRLERRSDQFDPNLVIPHWVIFRW
ncbi:MAG: DUF2782 domain-containing protein [Gammaproteobacteria bacterium]|nr:DUF2782 domain-containing protein [Gammaproteobacteria bacterium]